MTLAFDYEEIVRVVKSTQYSPIKPWLLRAKRSRGLSSRFISSQITLNPENEEIVKIVKSIHLRPDYLGP